MTISVILSEDHERFIEAQIASGRFADVSEVVSAGVALLEAREARLDVLRAEIQKGLEGPFIPAEEAFEYVREKVRAVARQQAENQRNNRD
ncbi:type II toxin-antitoxin system ParD family antitoxin [Asticcacaulis solisilvae]|uniref:type II toxin-antitoxin system ParD family antitoxin n=1 Tax=Asticcacaulis solisilvae TaxID=1217274 RepID=UPI003FD7793F